MEATDHERIGDILLDRGLIDEHQLEHALKLQAETGGLLGELLVSSLVLTEDQIADAVADQMIGRLISDELV